MARHQAYPTGFGNGADVGVVSKRTVPPPLCVLQDPKEGRPVHVPNGLPNALGWSPQLGGVIQQYPYIDLCSTEAVLPSKEKTVSDFWSDIPEQKSHHTEGIVPQEDSFDFEETTKGSNVKGILITLVVLALVAGGGYFFYTTHNADESAGTSAEPTSEEFTEYIPAPQTATQTATQTVTVTAQRPESEHPERYQRGDADSNPRDYSTTSVCDGRGVLIVNSIYGDSPTFNEEVAQTRSQYPGVEILAPGTCPSLRARHNGSPVYAAVIDYGHDIAALCAAEVPGELNARLLNNDSSYSSPC